MAKRERGQVQKIRRFGEIYSRRREIKMRQTFGRRQISAVLAKQTAPKEKMFKRKQYRNRWSRFTWRETDVSRACIIAIDCWIQAWI